MSFQRYLKEVEEKDQEDKVMGGIIDFFSTHEKPTDKDVHALAGELGIDEHKFEEKIYELISSFFNAGKYKSNPTEPDPEELKKGIEVEMEHTTSKAIAKRIALDHLAELKDYYSKLDKMEKSK